MLSSFGTFCHGSVGLQLGLHKSPTARGFEGGAPFLASIICVFGCTGLLSAPQKKGGEVKMQFSTLHCYKTKEHKGGGNSGIPLFSCLPHNDLQAIQSASEKSDFQVLGSYILKGSISEVLSSE